MTVLPAQEDLADLRFDRGEEESIWNQAIRLLRERDAAVARYDDLSGIAQVFCSKLEFEEVRSAGRAQRLLVHEAAAPELMQQLGQAQELRAELCEARAALNRCLADLAASPDDLREDLALALRQRDRALADAADAWEQVEAARIAAELVARERDLARQAEDEALLTLDVEREVCRMTRDVARRLRELWQSEPVEMGDEIWPGLTQLESENPWLLEEEG